REKFVVHSAANEKRKVLDSRKNGQLNIKLGLSVLIPSNVNLFSLQFFNGCKVMVFFRKKQDFC
ncbi:MAG: hypothetical protein ACI4AJ_05110, partial [Bacteroidaceae bacterium]